MSSKSTQNFWSQLLLSMIAIFALPNAQGIENSAPICENYSREQQAEQYTFNQLIQRKKIIQNPSHQIKWLVIVTEIFAKNIPHFNATALNLIAPIRAGPTFLTYPIH